MSKIRALECRIKPLSEARSPDGSAETLASAVLCTFTGIKQDMWNVTGHVTLDESCSKCLPWLRRQTRRNLTFNQPLTLRHYMDKPGINSEVQESTKRVPGREQETLRSKELHFLVLGPSNSDGVRHPPGDSSLWTPILGPSKENFSVNSRRQVGSKLY